MTLSNACEELQKIDSFMGVRAFPGGYAYQIIKTAYSSIIVITAYNLTDHELP
jgi:hypothetical protein